MNDKKNCDLCKSEKTFTELAEVKEICPQCQLIVDHARQHPDIIRKIWQLSHGEAGEPIDPLITLEKVELPEVLDGKRYKTTDREKNNWYLLISEQEGNPVEVFASTGFDKDDNLQSQISNLTTITRLISLILRHIFLHEKLTLEKCLKQLQRSSRQKNDLPDMLYGILNKYK